MSHTLKCDPQAGFSLIEACVVLAVMGTLLSMGLPAYMRYQQHLAWRKTDENRCLVEEALTVFFLVHGGLPRAADTTGQGVAGTAVGSVPYRALGLPQRATWDGANRPLRYAPNPALIDDAQAGGAKPLLLPDAGPLYNDGPRVTDGQGVCRVDDSISLAWVLVAGDHAKSADEQRNLDESMEFIDRPFSRNPDAPFQQRIFWMPYGTLYLKVCPYYRGPSSPQSAQASPPPGAGVLTAPTIAADALQPGEHARVL